MRFSGETSNLWKIVHASSSHPGGALKCAISVRSLAFLSLTSKEDMTIIRGCRDYSHGHGRERVPTLCILTEFSPSHQANYNRRTRPGPRGTRPMIPTGQRYTQNSYTRSSFSAFRAPRYP